MRETDHKRLWTDHFINNQSDVEFVIKKDRLVEGKNFGRIILKTSYQTISINVTVIQHEEEYEHHIIDVKKKQIELINNYIDFRFKVMSPIEYQDKMLALLQEMDSENVMNRFIKTHIGLVMGNEAIVTEFFTWAAEIEEPDMKHEVSFEEILTYSGYLYLKALYTRLDEDVTIAVNTIRGYYENGYQDWRLLWIDRKSVV